MIRYLIKNNVKLMLRNQWIIAVLILGPILVIAILSSAFSDLLKSYEGVDSFQAGYRLAKGSEFENSMDMVEKAAKKVGITLLEYPEGEPKVVIENNGLAGFVEFGTDTYTVYESADFETEGILLEYFLSRVMREAVKNRMYGAAFPEEKIDLPTEEINYMPSVNATDYYGIIYIIYFSWCSIVCIANVLSNEKKYGIEHRFQVSAVSGVKMYLAKWIPNVLAVSICLGVTVVVTVLLFDIHWGNILISALILLTTIMASSAFGLMCYSVFRNIAMTIIAVFTGTWFMGFFGGSFETYMYASWPQTLKALSPIYHTNRALVEISCMEQSSYTVSCIIYLFAIIVVCSAIAITTDSIRKRGRA